MAEREIHEMISAFAAGCMDRENFISFKNYISKGKDLPYRALGELQNIVSLLPALLEKEMPVELTREKMIEKISKHNQLEPDEAVEVKPTEYFQEKDDNPINVSEIDDEIADDEIKAPKLSFTKVPHKEQPVEEKPKIKDMLKPLNIKNYIRKPETRHILAVAAALFLFIVVVFNVITINLNNRIEALESEISGLRIEAQQNRDFVLDYNRLIDFFKYTDIKTIQLAGSEINPDRRGRIFLSLANAEGLVETADVPALPDDRTYQVWAFIDEDTFSLGTYKPEPGKKYYQLLNIPLFDISRLKKIEITSEPEQESVIPEGEVYYSSGG